MGGSKRSGVNGDGRRLGMTNTQYNKETMCCRIVYLKPINKGHPNKINEKELAKVFRIIYLNGETTLSLYMTDIVQAHVVQDTLHIGRQIHCM